MEGELPVDIPLQNGHTFEVAAAYCPTSDASSLDRLACYDSIRSCTRHTGSNDILMIGIDGNASVGVGEAYFERTSNSLGGRSLGPWGIAHTNAAGHELRSFLLSQNLSSAATFFRNSGAFDQRGQNNPCRNRFGSRRYATWHHPKSKLPFQLDHILVRGSDMHTVIFLRSSAVFSHQQ